MLLDPQDLSASDIQKLADADLELKSVGNNLK